MGRVRKRLYFTFIFHTDNTKRRERDKQEKWWQCKGLWQVCVCVRDAGIEHNSKRKWKRRRGEQHGCFEVRPSWRSWAKCCITPREILKVVFCVCVCNWVERCQQRLLPCFNFNSVTCFGCGSSPFWSFLVGRREQFKAERKPRVFFLFLKTSFCSVSSTWPWDLFFGTCKVCLSSPQKER